MTPEEYIRRRGLIGAVPGLLWAFTCAMFQAFWFLITHPLTWREEALRRRMITPKGRQ